MVPGGPKTPFFIDFGPFLSIFGGCSDQGSPLGFSLFRKSKPVLSQFFAHFFGGGPKKGGQKGVFWGVKKGGPRAKNDHFSAATPENWGVRKGGFWGSKKGVFLILNPVKWVKNR